MRIAGALPAGSSGPSCLQATIDCWSLCFAQSIRKAQHGGLLFKHFCLLKRIIITIPPCLNVL